MLRPLAIIAMGQQAHKTSLTKPFWLTTAQELVKNDLSTIGKVTKLGLPAYQWIWVLHGIPQFETQHCKFWQWAAYHKQPSLSARHFQIKRSIQTMSCQYVHQIIYSINKKEQEFPWTYTWSAFNPPLNKLDPTSIYSCNHIKMTQYLLLTVNISSSWFMSTWSSGQ